MPICISGMHRSGTSMVARLLNLCGLYLGEANEIPGPLPDNLEGHWENTLFRAVNDEILAQLSGGWDFPPPCPLGWEACPELACARDQATGLVQRFRAHEPWGWKDPRNSLTLSFWRKLMPDMKVIICLRNPVAVARSLDERSASSKALGLHLWLTYNQRALLAVPPQDRIITHYEAYFHDPKAELKRVLDLVGLSASEATIADACSSIQPALRHQQATMADLLAADLPEDVLECYADMCDQAGSVCQLALRVEPSLKSHPAASLGAAESDQSEPSRLLRLEALVVDKERAVQALSAELAERTSQIQAMSAELTAITTSTAWGLVLFLWRLRLALVPRGSIREGALRLGMRALRVGRLGGVAFLLASGRARNLRSVLRLPRCPLWAVYGRMRPMARRVLPYTWRKGISSWMRWLLGAQGNEALPVLDTAITSALDADTLGAPTNYDIVCFPIIEWEHRYQRPQQLASRFAEHGHRVFYVSLTFHGDCDSVRVSQVADRIYVVQLPGPVALDRFRESLPADARQRCLRALEEFCHRAGVFHAVCLVQLPFWTTLAFALREQRGWKVIFDCMDEHSGLTILEPELLQHEVDLARKADLVLVSSRKLWDKHASQAVRCQLLPNAADYDHFSRPAGGQDLNGLPRPILGYYGAIMEWFDVQMLREAALARPDWSFVLIGNVDNPCAESLRALANVHLLGEQPYCHLPNFLHQFDVCIIPFKLTPIVESTNPVKFYEYLSAGKPVVSVPMPELLTYGELYYPARNGIEIVAQAEKALQEDGPERIAVRKAWASRETWQARYEALAAAINDLHGLVSIVVVSYNGLRYTKACLESILRKTQYPRYEVIVVDNGSTSEVVRFLEAGAQRESRLRVILNRENLGFPRANNIGLQAANPDSEYLVLLNNDTIVTPGWLSTLVGWLRDPGIGLVGPVTCPSGAANEAAVPADYRNLGELDAFAHAHRAKHWRQSFDISMLAMYCVAMRRSVYEEIGLLDEDFALGMFEDDDYSLRVRNNGYRVVCAKDVFIHHAGRASFSRLKDAEYQALFERNRQRFERKWNVQWQSPARR